MLFTVIYCWYDNEVNVVFIGRVFVFMLFMSNSDITKTEFYNFIV